MATAQPLDLLRPADGSAEDADDRLFAVVALAETVTKLVIDAQEAGAASRAELALGLARFRRALSSATCERLAAHGARRSDAASRGEPERRRLAAEITAIVADDFRPRAVFAADRSPG